MIPRSAILVVAVLIVLAAHGQSSPSPRPPTGAPTADAKPAPNSPSVPPAGGAPSDLGSIPEHPSKPQTAVKKHLKLLEPHCMDAVLHTCWSAPSAQDSAADNPEFRKNLDVAKLYLSQKNYRGAESRLEDALAAKPNDPEATFLWAESLEKLHETSEAVEVYGAYLKLQPQGKYAATARKSLTRLEQKSASK